MFAGRKLSHSIRRTSLPVSWYILDILLGKRLLLWQKHCLWRYRRFLISLIWPVTHRSCTVVFYILYFKTYKWRMKKKTCNTIKLIRILNEQTYCVGICFHHFFYYFSCWPCRVVFFLQIETIAWPSLTTWVERTWGIWWCLRTRMTIKCISRNKERRETNGTGLVWTYIWTSVPL